MQSTREINVTSKMTKKRPKSATRFPKKMPTYVVAFALKETYDDLVTAQQMICKRSPQESSNSITPTNSLKMLEGDQVEKLDQIADVPEKYIKEELDDDIKQDKTVQETEITNQNEVKNSMNDVEDNSKEENHGGFDQPEIIFNAINYSQKYKVNKLLKRKSKSQKKINALQKIHKYSKPKNNKFESTITKNTLNNRLEKYYEKTKLNNSNTKQIQRGILKKVSAKENLLEEIELISISSYNEKDNLSLSPQFSKLNNRSFISNSSGNTLAQKSSTGSSQNDDVYSTGTVKSAIKIASDNVIPYKTDVINVAVAVAYKKSMVSTIEKVVMESQEKTNNLESLTSTETLTVEMTNLTSNDPSENDKHKSLEDKEMKNISSTNKKGSFESSDDDTLYDMARTSSDFNESSNESTFTLKNEMETVVDIESPVIEDDKAQMKRQSLLQTVINLGYYPEVTPSTSSAGNFDVGLNELIVTGRVNQTYSVNANNKGDNSDQCSLNQNFLTKQFNQQDSPPLNKTFHLPSQAAIKALLNESDISSNRKCSEECRHPSSIPELWDKLVLLLEIGLNKLEQNMTDNIVKEIKKAIAALELPVQKVRQIDVAIENEEVTVLAIEPPISSKVISVQKLKREANQSLQCDLVQNKIIDQIMLKVSSQGPKIVEPDSSLKSFLHSKKPKTFRDYFEVLKSPAVASPQILVDKGDTVTISTVTEDYDRFRGLKMMFVGTLTFFRENLFVITSVPAFFVVLIFVYGLLLLTLKPW